MHRMSQYSKKNLKPMFIFVTWFNLRFCPHTVEIETCSCTHVFGGGAVVGFPSVFLTSLNSIPTGVTEFNHEH